MLIILAFPAFWVVQACFTNNRNHSSMFFRRLQERGTLQPTPPTHLHFTNAIDLPHFLRQRQGLNVGCSKCIERSSALGSLNRKRYFPPTKDLLGFVKSNTFQLGIRSSACARNGKYVRAPIKASLLKRTSAYLVQRWFCTTCCLGIKTVIFGKWFRVSLVFVQIVLNCWSIMTALIYWANVNSVCTYEWPLIKNFIEKQFFDKII